MTRRYADVLARLEAWTGFRARLADADALGVLVGAPTWFRTSGPGGPGTRSYARHPAGFVMRARSVVDVLVDARSRVIVFSPLATEAAACEVLGDVLLPKLLDFLGRDVLHASAVVTGEGAIALMGPSGCGKTTLALRLAEEGLPLLGDDALLLSPDGLGLRALADGVQVASGTGKRRMVPARMREAGVLERVYVIRPGPAVRARRLTTDQAAAAIAPHFVRFDASDEERESQRRASMARVAGAAEVYLLHVPPGGLPAAARAIMDRP